MNSKLIFSKNLFVSFVLGILILSFSGGILYPIDIKASDRHECATLLQNQGQPTQTEQTLAAYLKFLMEQNLINFEDTLQFISNLIKGRKISPISQIKRDESSVHLVHHERFLALLERINPTSPTLHDLLNLVVSEASEAQKQTTETTEATTFPFIQAGFSIIQPGRFKDGVFGQVTHIISKAFGFQQIATTQWHWAYVMGSNPAANRHGNLYIVDGKPIEMNPDHPIESVSFRLVQEYIARINYWAETDDPRIYKIMKEHRPTYRYRLPTEAEWKLVATKQGTIPPNGILNHHEFENIGWHMGNSDRFTHEVATLPPLEFEGARIYDLFGNVDEFVSDRWGNPNLSGEIVDYQGPEEGDKIVVKGGNCTINPECFYPFYRDRISRTDYSSVTGFRLVRILEP